jgi:hypothetical protein
MPVGMGIPHRSLDRFEDRETCTLEETADQ